MHQHNIIGSGGQWDLEVSPLFLLFRASFIEGFTIASLLGIKGAS